MANTEEKSSHVSKNLVVYFYESTGPDTHDIPTLLQNSIIQGDAGLCQQLFYKQAIQPPKASVARRLGYRVGLTSDQFDLSHVDSPVVPAVKQAHDFVVKQHESGDQVIVMCDSVNDSETVLSAVELLVRCLINCDTLSALPLSSGIASLKHTDGTIIPVKAVIAGHHPWTWERGQDSINGLVDQLLLRLPRSVEQLIYWVDHTAPSPASCWTIRSPTGQIISKEVCFHESTIRPISILTHASKHLVHYKPDQIPDWDKQPPIRTYTYTGGHERPPPGDQDHPPQPGLGEPVLTQGGEESPIGRCRHQVAFYRWAEYPWDNSCLVWKSWCH